MHHLIESDFLGSASVPDGDQDCQYAHLYPIKKTSDALVMLLQYELYF